LQVEDNNRAARGETAVICGLGGLGSSASFPRVASIFSFNKSWLQGWLVQPYPSRVVPAGQKRGGLSLFSLVALASFASGAQSAPKAKPVENRRACKIFSPSTNFNIFPFDRSLPKK